MYEDGADICLCIPAKIVQPSRAPKYSRPSCVLLDSWQMPRFPRQLHKQKWITRTSLGAVSTDICCLRRVSSAAAATDGQTQNNWLSRLPNLGTPSYISNKNLRELTDIHVPNLEPASIHDSGFAPTFLRSNCSFQNERNTRNNNHLGLRLL